MNENEAYACTDGYYNTVFKQKNVYAPRIVYVIFVRRFSGQYCSWNGDEQRGFSAQRAQCGADRVRRIRGRTLMQIDLMQVEMQF